MGVTLSAASVAEEEHSGSSSLTSMANCGESRRFISSCFCQRRGREIPSFLSCQCVAPPLLLFECLTRAELPSHSGITSFWGRLLFDDHANLGKMWGEKTKICGCISCLFDFSALFFFYRKLQKTDVALLPVDT